MFPLRGSSQSPAQYSATEFLSTKLFSDIRVAPDGRHVAFVTSENDFKLDRTVSVVWLIAVDSSGKKTKMSRLTSADNVSEPKWSPDSRRLAARLGDEGKPSRLWIFDSKDQRSFAIADPQATNDGIIAFDWAPLDQTLYFASNNFGVGRPLPKTPGEVVPFLGRHETHSVTAFFRVAINGRGNKPVVQEISTIQDYDPVELAVSPDGNAFAIRLAGAIFLLNTEGKEQPRRLTPRFPCLDPGLTWTTRGIIFGACGVVKEKRTERTQRKVFLLHPESGQLEQLADDFTGEFWIEGIAPNGSILALGNLSTGWALYEIGASGAKANRLQPAQGPIRAISTSRSGNLTAFTKLEPQPELYLARDLTGPSTKVTDLNPVARKLEPDVETVKWDNRQGDVIEGVLYHPPGQKNAKDIPTIVFLHGGPWIAQTEPFYYGLNPLYMNEAYFLAQRGYKVFAPNFRASPGRGDAFLQAQAGYPCSRLTVDVLSGVDYLVEKGLAHPDRLGIMGSSYGGQLTNCIISRTPRFKAAAVQSGFWNLVSAQESINGKAPWEDLKTYWEESAVSRAADIKTPTLISIGGADERVNPEQAREEKRAFNRLRVPSELLVFPGERHRFFKPSNKRIRLEAQTAWFDHYLLGAPLP